MRNLLAGWLGDRNGVVGVDGEGEGDGESDDDNGSNGESGSNGDGNGDGGDGDGDGDDDDDGDDGDDDDDDDDDDKGEKDDDDDDDDDDIEMFGKFLASKHLHATANTASALRISSVIVVFLFVYVLRNPCLLRHVYLRMRSCKTQPIYAFESLYKRVKSCETTSL